MLQFSTLFRSNTFIFRSN